MQFWPPAGFAQPATPLALQRAEQGRCREALPDDVCGAANSMPQALPFPAGSLNAPAAGGAPPASPFAAPRHGGSLAAPVLVSPPLDPRDPAGLRRLPNQRWPREESPMHFGWRADLAVSSPVAASQRSGGAGQRVHSRSRQLKLQELQPQSWEQHGQTLPTHVLSQTMQHQAEQLQQPPQEALMMSLPHLPLQPEQWICRQRHAADPAEVARFECRSADFMSCVLQTAMHRGQVGRAACWKANWDCVAGGLCMEVIGKGFFIRGWMDPWLSFMQGGVSHDRYRNQDAAFRGLAALIDQVPEWTSSTVNLSVNCYEHLPQPAAVAHDAATTLCFTLRRFNSLFQCSMLQCLGLAFRKPSWLDTQMYVPPPVVGGLQQPVFLASYTPAPLDHLSLTAPCMAVPALRHVNINTTPIPNTVPTVEGVDHLHPLEVAHLLSCRGCILVDVRGEDRKSGLIGGAVHEPAIGDIPFVTRAPALAQRWAGETLVVFTCQYSAHRAPQCANWYRPHAGPGQRVAILEGGFRGWEAAGLKVTLATPDALESTMADAYALEVGMNFAATAAAREHEAAGRNALLHQEGRSLTPQNGLGVVSGANGMNCSSPVHARPPTPGPLSGPLPLPGPSDSGRDVTSAQREQTAVDSPSGRTFADAMERIVGSPVSLPAWMQALSP
ncbi:unnamed protein product [Polarella glacialis]|uniref:Rhodanese domain-containing protein n=1 Tax=Polarella glacialis TaxID=89957 RepID=A0A813EK03_POLGL|nr:unnamed protein product [Polarella glacialis]